MTFAEKMQVAHAAFLMLVLAAFDGVMLHIAHENATEPAFQSPPCSVKP